ncbi:MAG: DNA gyrase inhibitor YacG [Casimicrobiaceae bacterium]
MTKPVKRRRGARCPQCGKAAELAPENRFRPFCSERCKLIDLGAWASESYRVPVAEDPADPDADDAKTERS